MKIRKTVLFGTAAVTAAMLIAGGMRRTSGRLDAMPIPKGLAEETVEAALKPKRAEADRFNPHDVALPLPETETAVGAPEISTPAVKGKLPGIFRGDWGETPSYALNDRVNYEGSAYLSLQGDNQNQPPDSSPDYWRLLTTFKAADLQTCREGSAGADLTRCDFSGDIRITDRNLAGAVLTKARLSGELGSADLTGANLSGAAVIGSLVADAETRLEGANLSRLQSGGNNPLIAESAHLKQANFSKANLYGARLSGADLTGARFENAILTGTQLTGAQLANADMRQSNLNSANLSNAELPGAVLQEANLSDAYLTGAQFTDANLRQANLAGAELGGSDLSGADLRGANLAAAKGTESAIVDGATDFLHAVCPDGVTVDGARVVTCIGHGF